jgi:hypothetical protein
MTTRVEPVPTPPRTRRALLAGALGGLAAWAAAAAARADPTAAAAGDPIRMGQINSPGGRTTTLQMAGGSGAAMRVVQGGGGSAVRAESTSGRAVQARAGSDGTGVWAYSPDHYGVYAQTDSGVAVRAEAWGAGGTAVTGGSDLGSGVSFASAAVEEGPLIRRARGAAPSRRPHLPERTHRTQVGGVSGQDRGVASAPRFRRIQGGVC